MRLFEIEGLPKYLYHVTFKKNIPSITKAGLEQFHDSNWVRAGSGKRYNEDAGIFAFEHPDDAIRWALKMEWDFDDGPISIVRIESEDFWEEDPAQDIMMKAMAQGRALRSSRNIKADKIIDVFDMEDFGKPGILGISPDEWVAGIRNKLQAE